MFTFILQENKTDIEIIITRILLAVVSIVTFTYSGTYYWISIIAAVFLLAASYFVKAISVQFKISRPVILMIAALILLTTTHSFIFAGILLAYGALLKYFQRKPEVIITTAHIVLKKMFTDEIFSWPDFNNIILKDGLLTLDFVDNKLLQLSVDEANTVVNEKEFNLFCSDKIITSINSDL
jgi:hypothetical protein